MNRKLVALMIILVVCGLSQAATKVLEWKFEGNLNDTSGYGNNGTDACGVAAYTAGVVGQAFVSDGNIFVYDFNVEPEGLLPIEKTDEWSVNVWVCPTIPPEDWRLAWCIGMKPSGNSGFSRCVYSPASKTIVFVDGSANYLSTGVPWDVNQWQMITTTYDNHKVRLYKNGILIGSKNYTTFVDGPNWVRIPANSGSVASANSVFSGKFDEFTVWNGALTQEEIINLIPPGVLPPIEPIQEMVYYTMDDPCTSAMKMPDHSGNANDGVFYGYDAPLARWQFPGQKGAGFLFDGSESIDLPMFTDPNNNFNISRYTQYSVAFWFRSGYQPYYTAFYDEDSPENGNGSMFIIRGDAGTTGAIKVYSKDCWYQTEYVLSYDASAYMHSDKWHHLAFTADGNQARLYLDGELVKWIEDPNGYNTGAKTGMTASVGYNWETDRYLGEWDRTYMDEFHLYKGVLSQEQIKALMAEGNLNNDFDVDTGDLASFSDEWLAPSTVGTTLVVDDMEGTLGNWIVSGRDANDANNPGTGTISITNNAYRGNQAMRWDYNIPAPIPPQKYTSVSYNFGTDRNLTDYNLMRIYLYRHAGNPPEVNGLMFVKFLDSTWKSKAELWIQGPNSVVLPTNKWDESQINLDAQMRGPDGVGYVTKSVLTAVRYVMIGLGSPGNGNTRTGRIDIDEVKIYKLPLCSPYLIGDLNSDCKADFRDFVLFADDWLLGVH